MSGEASLERLRRARSLVRAREADEALRLLSEELVEAEAVGDGDRTSAVLGELAEIQLTSERWGEAEASISRLASGNPWRAGVERMWLAYFRRRPAEGLGELPRLLEGAHVRGERLRARMAHAAGKLCQIDGAADAARRWLLEALRHARAAREPGLVSACAGSLGEVLYQGGRPLAALDLFSLSTSLLPPGDVQVERLMGYRAHCYRQCGQLEAARSLYEECVQALELRGAAAADGGRASKPSYSIRGLLWCDALEAARNHSGEAAGRVKSRLIRLRQDDQSCSLGYGLLGAAWLDRLRKKRAEAEAQVAEARKVFAGAGYAPESAWCAAVLGNPLALPEPAPPVLPDGAPLACDRWILDVPLQSRRERFLAGVKGFHAAAPGDGPAWMGLFF